MDVLAIRKSTRYRKGGYLSSHFFIEWPKQRYFAKYKIKKYLYIVYITRSAN